jgi:hypothetical protein
VDPVVACYSVVPDHELVRVDALKKMVAGKQIPGVRFEPDTSRCWRIGC